MNKIDKSSQFDSRALREALQKAPADHDRVPEPDELNRIAKQTAKRLAQESYTPTMITGLLRLGEFSALFLIGLAIHLIYDGPSLSLTAVYYVPALLFGSVMAIIVMQLSDCYQVPALRTAIHTYPRVLASWTGTLGVMAVIGFFLQFGLVYSRLWFLAWFVAGIVVLFLSRTLLAFAIRRWARNGVMERRAVIVGGGNIGYRLAKALEKRYRLKIIEHNPERARYLSENLDRTVVLHGSGTDKSLLEEENIENTDVFCALTNDDEVNIMASLLAKRRRNADSSSVSMIRSKPMASRKSRATLAQSSPALGRPYRDL